LSDKRLAVDDVTVVMGLRAHQANPWVLPRLRAWADHYDPRPRVLVVDLGSTAAFAKAIRDTCRFARLELVRSDDAGVYSQAIARNIGAARVETPLVFFTDVDCIGPRDFFRRLVAHANALGLASCFDQPIILPAYHLESEASASVLAARDAGARDERLARAFVDAVFDARGATAEYVDPFSNMFLCHRDFFSLVGGYDHGFRGHGSEDFELMLRMCLHSGQLPIPERPASDLRGPTDPGFWGIKPYEGFRRLGEAAAFQSELAGLRVAHLHHDRSRGDRWYDENDWERQRFEPAVREDMDGWTRLLARDFLPRQKHTLGLVRAPWEASLMLALRLDSHRVIPVECSGDRVTTARAELERESFDHLVFVDDADGDALEVLCRQRGVVPIRLRCGSREGSWFFDGLTDEPSRFLGDRVGGYRVEELAGSRHVRYERALQRRPMDLTSYAAARLGTAIAVSPGGLVEMLPESLRRWVPRSVREEPPHLRALRKARKLLVDPGRFFADSRVASIRWLARRMRQPGGDDQGTGQT
jgi:predicted glycosyltransferase involved in capsule biosynthesis